jgi:hypothetical protein
MIRPPRFSSWILFTAVVGVAPASQAADVDPNVVRALDLGALRVPARARTIAPEHGAPVLIELDRPLSAEVKTRLQKAGVSVESRTGGARGLQRFLAATIDRHALNNLQKLPEIRRISLVPPRGPLPLDHTTALLNVASVHGGHDGIDQLTGRGMLVADTDSNADVFHPHFFHADGGYLDWIDVDGNGVFDPGVDAIDLDGDGEVSPREVGRVLSAATYSRRGGLVPARGMGFDAGLDWIYLDENDNGKRDYGVGAGFGDDVPALGEPLFVPDDVNRNGQMDVGERFVRLGTSKFRKVYTRVPKGYVNKTHIYERGVDLSTHVNELNEGNALGSDASHGTGVLSILLGDVPLVGRRWVGVAPEAEAILVADFSGGVAGATWMLDEKPDVALWEMAPWAGLPLDGTDPYSQLVDATAESDDILHACPVGNTGGAQKHAQVAIPAGQTTTVTFENPAYLAPMYIQLSLNIRGASDLGVKLREPGGTEVDLVAKAGKQSSLLPGIVLYPTVQTTSRGTYFVDTVLYAYQPSKDPMPTGDWELEIEGHEEKDATLDAYVMDEVSSWGKGVAFPSEVATDVSTIGAPAVADHAFALGAFTGHPSTPQATWFVGDEPAGQVRGYSGRGPRIDGLARLDVVAPDNPFAAAPYMPDYFGYGEVAHGGFWVFGGTSGAGPHVAGVAVLLAQAGIRGKAAREAIMAGATKDAQTLADPNAYGAGRLNAAGALGIEVSDAPPTVAITLASSPVFVGRAAELQLTVADPQHPESSLVARWDDGYDGTWDTDYESSFDRTVVHEEVGRFPYKVRVRNPGGRVAEAVLWVTVEEAPPEQPDAGLDAGLGEDAPAGPAATPSTEPGGGCGCRTVSRGSTGGGALLAILLGAGLAVRRRRGHRGPMTFAARA